MILFVTTADTEIIAAERARTLLPEGFPEIRSVNPSSIEDGRSFAAQTLPGARAVIVRLLGGRKAWPDFDVVRGACMGVSLPLLAFGGEASPDAEMTAASTVAPGVAADAFEYLRHGGVENVKQLLLFLSDTLLMTGYGFEPPAPASASAAFEPPVARTVTIRASTNPSRRSSAVMRPPASGRSE